jgi:ubiquinone/menaquinone biosynthesis C-methylase UbiE
MRNEELFSTQASTYAQFRPSYPLALFNSLASLVKHHTIAWDCATGNGQSAQSLAHLFPKVIATDANPRQIKQTVRQPGILYALSHAENAALASHSVNLVTVSQAIHWFNLDLFYAEIKRVVVPGGIIAAWCYAQIDINPAINAIFKHLMDDITGPYWSPRRQMVDEHYRTLPFPFDEINMPPYAIQVNLSLGSLKGYVDSWSATQKFIETRRYNPWDEIENDMLKAWGDPFTLYPAQWPLYLRVGRLPE